MIARVRFSRSPVSTNRATSCDAILLLPGWERSKGARAELTIALEKHLEIITFCDLMQNPYLYTPEKA